MGWRGGVACCLRYVLTTYVRSYVIELQCIPSKCSPLSYSNMNTDIEITFIDIWAVKFSNLFFLKPRTVIWNPVSLCNARNWPGTELAQMLLSLLSNLSIGVCGSRLPWKHMSINKPQMWEFLISNRPIIMVPLKPINHELCEDIFINLSISRLADC